MSGLRRIPEIQARLDRWAVWVSCGYGYGGGAGSPIGYLMDLAAGKRVSGSECSSRSFVPVDDIECAKTERAVNALPEDLKKAVHAWHRSKGGSLADVAKQLNIVKTTLWRRLAQADHRINDWLLD